MKLLDKELKGFLDRVLKPVDNPVGSPERADVADVKELVVNGEGNLLPDELCLDDISVKCEPKYLKDHLPIFAPADEIIKMEKVFKEKPELRNAERSDHGGKGGCDGCKANSGCSGSEEQEKED